MPEEKTFPRIEMVSAWDFHPDPSATSIDDCEYVIERHRMNRQQLRALSSVRILMRMLLRVPC
jgi:hypothetical protein